MKRRSGGFRNARSTNSWFCCFGLVCLFVCQKYVTLVAGHMTGWTIDDIKKDTTWRRVTKEEKQRIDMRVAQAVTSTWRMVDSGSEESSEESPMSLDRPPKAVAAAPPVRRAQGAGRIRQATCASCIACCAPFFSFVLTFAPRHTHAHTGIGFEVRQNDARGWFSTRQHLGALATRQHLGALANTGGGRRSRQTSPTTRCGEGACGGLEEEGCGREGEGEG